MVGEAWRELHEMLDMHVVIDAVKAGSDGETGEIEGQAEELAGKYSGAKPAVCGILWPWL